MNTLYATEWSVGYALPSASDLNCFAVINHQVYPVAFMAWIGAQALVQHANGTLTLVPAERVVHLPTVWATPTGQRIQATRELLSRRVGFAAVRLVVTARQGPPLPEVFFDFRRLTGGGRAYALALTTEADTLYRRGQRLSDDRLVSTWPLLPAADLVAAVATLDMLDPLP
jgi:hypothetical protein